jgi:hypothetical protein
MIQIRRVAKVKAKVSAIALKCGCSVFSRRASCVLLRLLVPIYTFIPRIWQHFFRFGHQEERDSLSTLLIRTCRPLNGPTKEGLMELWRT